MMKTTTSTLLCRFAALTVLLHFACVSASYSQAVTMRTKYYLVSDTIALNYYTKAEKPASAKEEKVRIVTYRTNTMTVVDDITRVTTTPPSESKVKFRKYDKFLPKGTGFSVEQKKDTLFLTPIPWYAKKGGTLTNEQQQVNASRLTNTYFIAIPKKTGYTTLFSKYNEFGVLAIPARLYLTINSGLKARPVLGAGVAAYYGWTKGTDYFYDSGTSLRTTRTNGIYAGFSSISLKASNTDNKVTVESDEPALTLGITQLWGRGDFKLGFVEGTDIPLTKAGWKWDFAPSIYLGVVVSLAISPLSIK